MKPSTPHPDPATTVAARGDCPRCGYSLTGLGADAGACPECGLDGPVFQSAIRNPQSQILFRPWLHAYAVLLVVATFVLLILGGTVTSKGAGLAVPDWPTTFNYHMFLFPPDMWKGNIFWEHLHRLVASGVGLMTIVMAIWLWHTQGPEIPGGRRWLRQLGVATLILVIAQGVMGGLRVTQLSVAFAIFHGFTAQVFLCMTVLIAAATSRWWIESATNARIDCKAQGWESLGVAHDDLRSAHDAPRFAPAALRRALIACYAFLIVGFIQLALGATVRHHGAGLAIPDFPLSYGNIVPPLTQSAIDDAMTRFASDPEDWASRPHENYTPFHVAIHLSHRLWAVVVLAAGAWLFASVRRHGRVERKITRPAAVIAGLLLVQVALGATIIWTGRHPEIATAHQTLGAAILATAALILFRLHALKSSADSNPHASQSSTELHASALRPPLPPGEGWGEGRATPGLGFKRNTGQAIALNTGASA